LSRERVRMEFVKLLVAPRAAVVLEAMADTGLFGLLLDGVPNGVNFSAMVAIERALSLSPDAMRRLAALAVLVAEDAQRLWQKLRLSNAEHAQLAAMAEGWRRISPGLNEHRQKALLYRLGAAVFTDQALLGWARSGAGADDKDWRALATLPQRWTAPAFPIKAADLMARGVEKGPKLGAALETAEKAWIAAGFPSAKPDIDAIAEAAAKG
jgi:poly(A) polymerase